MDDLTPDGTGEPAVVPAAPAVDRMPLDTIAQRLFAVGLTVQSVATSLRGDERAVRLRAAVADIDVTIREVRTHMQQTTTRDAAPATDERP